jgi:hypothetical protein
MVNILSVNIVLLKMCIFKKTNAQITLGSLKVIVILKVFSFPQSDT